MISSKRERRPFERRWPRVVNEGGKEEEAATRPREPLKVVLREMCCEMWIRDSREGERDGGGRVRESERE